jgi:hypothetical protein
MCVCASGDEMMCRIGPVIYEEALEKNGCRPMVHNGKMMKGFVYISEEGMKSKKKFNTGLSWRLTLIKPQRFPQKNVNDKSPVRNRLAASMRLHVNHQNKFTTADREGCKTIKLRMQFCSQNFSKNIFIQIKQSRQPQMVCAGIFFCMNLYVVK